MTSKLLHLGFIFIFLTSPTYAQTRSQEDIQAAIIEATGLVLETDSEYEQLEYLLELYQDPIDLNKASYEELTSILVLSEQQVTNLLDHIANNGPLYSPYELQSIPSFVPKTINTLLLFAEIKEKKEYSKNWKGYMLMRSQRIVQKKNGFRNSTGIQSKFHGSPTSSLIKVRGEKNRRYGFGITLESDAGEPLKWSPGSHWYGPSFHSMYIEYKGGKVLQNVVLGDLTASWGQGLVFGSGFSIGKGRMTTSVHKRVSTGIKPYRSTLEYGFMRGLGLTINTKLGKLSWIISGLGRDANLNDEGEISSLITSGLHRTQSEISKRKTISEKLAGFNYEISNRNRHFSAGISAAYTQFDHKLSPEEKPSNIFLFRGRENIITGIYSELRYRNTIFYGEGAINKSGGHGFILSTLINFSHHLEGLLSLRKYSPDFVSFYASNAFRESSNPRNENGIYLGLKYSVSKSLSISTYADIYTFPWLKSTMMAPSNGFDYLMDISWSPNESLQIRSMYKIEDKGIETKDEDYGLRRTSTQNNRLVKLDLKMKLSKYLSSSSGVWFTDTKKDINTYTGSLLYLGFSFSKAAYTMKFRAAITDSNNYAARFYMYEPDVLYAFSVPVLYGQNIRYIYTFKYKVNRKLAAWFKWSHATYRDRKSLGSGIDKIDGSIRTDLKIQVIYKL